jgi:hypothetical protein
MLDTQDGGMGEIVNLRRVKKRREQEAETVAAKRNRVRHGRTGAEKANDKRAEERRQALLDAARRARD